MPLSCTCRHYFERFTNHAKSLALEKKGLEPQLKVKAPATQPIFAAAIKALRQARVILKNTYAFAYYLKPSGQRTIFEDNQEVRVPCVTHTDS